MPPAAFHRAIPERSDQTLELGVGQAWGVLAALAGDATPAAWMEILLERFLEGTDRSKAWRSALLGDPLIDDGAAVGSGFGAVGGGFAGTSGLPLGRGLTEGGIKGAAVLGPERLELLPDPFHPGRQLSCQRLLDGEIIVVAVQLGAGLTVEAGEPLAEAAGVESGLPQAGQLLGVEGLQQLAPDLLHHLLHLDRGVCFQLRVHGGTTAECLTTQAAAAEPMDGGDVGTIELFQCHQQLADPVVACLCVVIAGQPRRENGIGRWGIGDPLLLRIEPLKCRLQPSPDPGAELRSGCIGVGHDQEAVEALARFGDQPQGEVSQGKRFSCAGAGLQQPHTGVQGIRIGVELFSHGASVPEPSLRSAVCRAPHRPG